MQVIFIWQTLQLSSDLFILWRYGLYDFEYEHQCQGTTDSSKKQKLFLMSWCPDRWVSQSRTVTTHQSRRHLQRQNQEENVVFIILRRLEKVPGRSSQIHPGDWLQRGLRGVCWEAAEIHWQSLERLDGLTFSLQDQPTTYFFSFVFQHDFMSVESNLKVGIRVIGSIYSYLIISVQLIVFNP